jgi:hypothetical protein
MDLQKLMTVENLLKVLLAIAIGVMLYKVFFGKEKYDNYPDESGYKYPMDYEEDIDLVDAVTEDGDVDDMDLVSADSEEDDADQIEEIEDVVDAEDDIYEYADEENEAYDDSEEIVTDGTEDADAEDDDNMYMYEEDVVDEENDELVEEVMDDMVEDSEETQSEVGEVKNFDLMYASDVEDGLQESFMLYSNLVGVDTNYA